MSVNHPVCTANLAVIGYRMTKEKVIIDRENPLCG